MPKSRLSPTQRSLAMLRDRGCYVAQVERFLSYVGPHGIRSDMFGFGDLVAIEPGQVGVLAIQCCAGSGFAAHKKKILEECHEEALAWVRAQNRIEIHAWRKVKVKRGGKAERWSPRVEVIGEEEFDGR